MKSIGLLPDCRHTRGGPGSFQRKLVAGLSSRGFQPCFDLGQATLDALLLINATKHVSRLWRARRQGVPIVQRLGTPFSSGRPSRRDFVRRMRIWLGMQNVAYVRAHLADKVVYQSRFAQECWDRGRRQLRKPTRIIYNGVDLSQFSPEGPKYTSNAKVCVISVEGTQPAPDGHPALLLASALVERGLDIELLLFGQALPDTARLWDAYPFVKFAGRTPNADLAFFYRGSTLFVSTDVIAACPNSVIEALACGTPVVGYQFSVLPEILDSSAGRCVPPKGDPWKGEHPGNVEGLVEAALEIIEDDASFRANARKLAESRYSLDHMVDEYVDFLLQG